MTVGMPGAPFPVTYRELYLPPGIKGWNGPLPTSVEGGHELTFTGARHGTTADGVHGIAGVATSNINLGAIHNAENILYIKIRFRLDAPFAAGAPADQYLFGKFDGANDYLMGWLEAADGMFHMAHAEAAAVEAIVSAEDSWDIGWHTIVVSLHNVNGQRLRVDGSAAVVEAGNTTAISLAADFVLLARDDGVSIEGLTGVEVDVVMGIAALTVAQEDDLYNGIPPAAATESYLLDEGRGVIAYDRGTGGNNGTLDTTATWAFGQVQQPVISLDAINDTADSPAGQSNFRGDITMVWVAKLKSTYSGINRNWLYITFWDIDGNNRLVWQYDQVADYLNWSVSGGGVSASINFASTFSIDNYLIMLGVADDTHNQLRLYLQGVLVGTNVGSNPRAGNGMLHLSAGNLWDPSKPLFVALIDGAFTNQQALAYSRYLRNVFNLPIAI